MAGPQESYVVVNGIRHWVRRAGRRRQTPLVVVHGGPGGTIYDFERITGPALERLVDVIYYEQRGSGRSEPPADGDYSIAALVNDLVGLLDQLAVEQAFLLGISFGGDLAAEFTTRHPERVRGLLLQGTGLTGPLTPSPEAAGFDAVAADDETRASIRRAAARGGIDAVWDVVDQSTVDRFLFHVPGSANRVRALWRASGLHNSGAMAAALASAPARCRPLVDDLAQISVPTLILIGLWDRNAGVDAARDLATRLQSAQLVVFEQSAHFPNVDEPDRYVEVIIDFLGAAE